MSAHPKGRPAADAHNQSPPFAGHNAFLVDPLLRDIADAMPRALRADFEATGRFVASAEAHDLARIANRSEPELRTLGPSGDRLDLVEFHPAYHALMRRSSSIGLQGSVWEDIPAERGVAHQARALRFFLTAGLESGHLCPLTMTNAAVAAIMASPRVEKTWLPKIVSRKYDSAQKPAMQKSGVTIGMGMTERQGGTDVRTNRSTGEKVGEGIYRLAGDKWFLSAPMSDAFVMLARTGEEISCFLVPRILEDGSRNGLRFQRLKDKLGNRSNASAEVEFSDTFGFLLGEEGKGIRTILDMVTLTRLDCSLGSAGMMRASLAEAVHHCRHRVVFGKKLVDQPLMTRVLADLTLDVAAAAALSMRLARAFDKAHEDPAEAAFARLMTPVVKYWVCKIAPSVIYEAMECLGGNGYIEERPLARHYREAPVNAIWEGSGNVMALDVLRVLARGPELFDVVLAGLSEDLGPAGSRTVDVLKACMAVSETDEAGGRMLTEQLALAAAGAELTRLGAGMIAEAFVETRLGGAWRATYGMLDARFDANRIIDVLYPPVD
ncbi:acyl-CoA dehydrogenase family protein [Pseudohoeflea coraliihabitans]|uniref:Acyl-CoA dehydrogenase family protein n=1 Tax=Pseudohoeflea coraliihabitans TaxID=2860393 RepID=A0ABS6WSJ9_9HYPH|nr:acyl-CoA dehydrogenase family protein [Pseudohoeflea sp. DP4N28-3]MBW3098920.1 acyl-CoA dehydrogenase family protein [Pseudohoeflea sp. DP4N28-3]